MLVFICLGVFHCLEVSVELGTVGSATEQPSIFPIFASMQLV
jgi:hypothetical protein